MTVVKVDIVEGSNLVMAHDTTGTRQGVAYATRKAWVEVAAGSSFSTENAITQVLTGDVLRVFVPGQNPGDPPTPLNTANQHPADTNAVISDISAVLVSPTKAMVTIRYKNPMLVDGVLVPPGIRSHATATWSTSWISTPDLYGPVATIVSGSAGSWGTSYPGPFPIGVPQFPDFDGTTATRAEAVQAYNSLVIWRWTMSVDKITINCVTPTDPSTVGNDKIAHVNLGNVDFLLPADSNGSPRPVATGRARYDGYTSKFDGLHHVAYHFTVSRFGFLEQVKVFNDIPGNYSFDYFPVPVYPFIGFSTNDFPGIT